jgi:hypothetical protein
MDGSAERVELRKDKICLCCACAEDIDIVNTDEVFILDEDRLAYTLNNFEQVDGLRHIGKARGPHGNIISDKRSGSDRRSGEDRRSLEPEVYGGHERRSQKYRRSADRRMTPEKNRPGFLWKYISRRSPCWAKRAVR